MKQLFTIGVTGGRDYKDKVRAWSVLDAAFQGVRDNHKAMFLVVGCCPTGLDKHVRDWAELQTAQEDFDWKVYHADWAKYGPSAGPIRNSAMIDHGLDVLLSFPGGRGTADCTKKARRAGVTVKEIS